MAIDLVVEEVEENKGNLLCLQIYRHSHSTVPKKEVRAFERRLYERTIEAIKYDEDWEARSVVKARTIVLGSSRIIGHGSLVYQI